MVYISLVELLPGGIDDLADVVGERAALYGIIAFFGGVALIAGIDRLVPEPINPHEFPDEGAQQLAKATMKRAGLLTAVAIGIHGATNVYRLGSTRWLDVTWPGPPGAFVTVQRRDGTLTTEAEGDWAVFRLMPWRTRKTSASWRPAVWTGFMAAEAS